MNYYICKQSEVLYKFPNRQLFHSSGTRFGNRSSKPVYFSFGFETNVSSIFNTIGSLKYPIKKQNINTAIGTRIAPKIIIGNALKTKKGFRWGNCRLCQDGE